MISWMASRMYCLSSSPPGSVGPAAGALGALGALGLLAVLVRLLRASRIAASRLSRLLRSGSFSTRGCAGAPCVGGGRSTGPDVRDAGVVVACCGSDDVAVERVPSQIALPATAATAMVV